MYRRLRALYTHLHAHDLCDVVRSMNDFALSQNFIALVIVQIFWIAKRWFRYAKVSSLSYLLALSHQWTYGSTSMSMGIMSSGIRRRCDRQHTLSV